MAHATTHATLLTTHSVLASHPHIFAANKEDMHMSACAHFAHISGRLSPAKSDAGNPETIVPGHMRWRRHCERKPALSSDSASLLRDWRHSLEPLPVPKLKETMPPKRVRTQEEAPSFGPAVRWVHASGRRLPSCAMRAGF